MSLSSFETLEPRRLLSYTFDAPPLHALTWPHAPTTGGDEGYPIRADQSPPQFQFVALEPKDAQPDVHMIGVASDGHTFVVNIPKGSFVILRSTDGDVHPDPVEGTSLVSPSSRPVVASSAPADAAPVSLPAARSFAIRRALAASTETQAVDS